MRPQRAKYCTGRSGGRKPIRKAAEVKILSLCDACGKASPSQNLLPDLRLRLVRDRLNELDPGVAVSYCKDVANGGLPVAWKISQIMKVDSVDGGALNGVRVCDFQNLSSVAVVAFGVGTEDLTIFSNQLSGFRLGGGAFEEHGLFLEFFEVLQTRVQIGRSGVKKVHLFRRPEVLPGDLKRWKFLSKRKNPAFERGFKGNRTVPDDLLERTTGFD